jgi:hypothetical protein
MNHEVKMEEKTKPPIIDNPAQKAAQKLVDQASEVLAEKLKSENETVQLKAVELVMDRAYGKPTQHVETTLLRDPKDLSDSELARVIAEDDQATSGTGIAATERMPPESSSVH